MKKLQILLLGFIAIVFVSCKDTSGKYVTKQLTYTQMENAFNDCLELATEMAVESLCPEDELDYILGYGYYDYEDQAYRITLPTSARAIVDSLTAHGQGALIDTMVLHINRAAEASGSAIGSAYSSARSSLTYTDHQALVSTSNTHALTEYFKTQCSNQIHQSLMTPVRMKLTEKGVPDEWDNILSVYYTYNPQPVSIDLYSYIVDKMMDGIFTEMGYAEELIRTDPTLRVTESMELVFGN
ncbi:MAG: DUF4197 domain-containing protein [Bacteroidales bacterium]|nr:DUF4197 domain-containing protein [Bacteroidales bacterium]